LNEHGAMLIHARNLLVATTVLAAACGGSTITEPGGGGGGGDVDAGGTGAGSNPGTGSGTDPNTVADPLSPTLGFKTGQAQHDALCAHNFGDAVTKAFCASATQPPLASIVDVQKLIGLDFKAGQTGNAKNGNPAFVLTGHSSSLVTKFTSAINPRVIIFTPPNSTGRVNNPKALTSFTAMGFVRGEQFVEMVSNDPTANGGQGDLNFFLLRFDQACNTAADGCSFDDLLTPKVESNFTAYSVYSEDDLKNSIFDCKQCHQTAGPGTPKILRQQELQNPWGHFFRNNRANGQALLADYAAAHGATEAYGGIPGAAITNSDPAQLEGLVENQGFKNQPNEFNTNQLLDQGASTGWLTLYDNAKAGKDIPAPYHENRVTDPTKLATATTAYKTALTGTPLTMDIREVFDDNALQDLQFRPSADLVTAGDGRGILTQICQQCHNPSLDQTLTRARFDVTKLDTMSRAEKDTAITRLQLPVESSRKMPPQRFRSLSDAEIKIVVQALQQ
jgi:cytochrome c5